MRQPKEFTSIPIKATEEWIVAKFLSDKPFFFTDPDLKITYELKPEMQVIAFLSEKFKEDKLKREKEESESGKIRIRFTNPYKDYPDYLKGTYRGGGFFIDEEVETEIDGMKVTQYLVKVEKGANGPRRVIAWVYHTEDIDFAIQFECFEDSWRKLKSDITRSMKSFEEIERTEGSVVKEVATDGVIEFTDTAWSELPAKEREKIRKGKEKRTHEQALVGLPDSWEVIEEDGFLVLNHGGDKAADNIVEQGDAVFRWCEKHLGFIGSDEYVMRPVIRICKDQDEEFAFRQGSDWFKPSLEIVTHKDTVGIGSWEYRWLNSRFLGHWLWQSDGDLMVAMPAWMKFGLQYVVQYGKHKGKKFELRHSDWEMMGLRERVKSGMARSPREIFLSDSDGFASSQNGAFEAAALTRYLLVGSGSKKRLTRNLLEDYYSTLKEVTEELEERESPSGTSTATTEEEEDAQFKAAQQRWKKREREVAEMVFERVFAGWSEKDWSAFERDYFKAIS